MVLPLPQPGVYAVTVIGAEQLALAAGLIGPIRRKASDGGPSCLRCRRAHRLRRGAVAEHRTLRGRGRVGVGQRPFHSFGLDDLLDRVASPLSLDATSWLCENESSVAERAVTAETAMRDVAGAPREVVVFMTELVRGDHPDNVELIELWVDETGVPVREALRLRARYPAR